MAKTFLIVLPFLPMLLAPLSYFFSKKEVKAGYAGLISTCLIVLAMSVFLFLNALQNNFPSAEMPALCYLGVSFRADGFRSLYLVIASFMWLMTSLFTPQYMSHGHKQGRYCFYTLFTLGATLGVFVSDDLFTAFLFFEIMSFTSYPWVIHEEEPAAMRAGATYLAIAVLGGMMMLMGLFILKPMLGTLSFDKMWPAVQAMEDKSGLLLPSVLILLGFGAKAGMFPLHVWLPKAHPVAPAPASALLSGVLTKVGVFGILAVSCRIMLHDHGWGNLILALGLITMFAGALLALLSVDLKRTLACSSMSQIGFILVGVAMQALLGEHNALAAEGTVLHMVNHSLIKLTLFMAAGVVHMNLHKLNLNDVRGFGRNKPFLHLCFIVGAASISGIPFFSGYVSKTLLHESILEYVEHLHHLGESGFWYAASEWVFVITGGMTFAYMLKLYICLFWQKNERQQAMDDIKPYINPVSRLALGLAALVLFLLGIRPHITMTPLAEMSLPFMQAHAPEHAVAYFSLPNLLGTGKSLLIGLVLYFAVVRPLLMTQGAEGRRVYVDRKPIRLDMEDSLYRPLLRSLCAAGTVLIASPAHHAPDYVFKGLLWFGKLLARTLSGLTDGAAALLGRTVFAPPRPHRSVPVGNRFTYATGRLFNACAAFKNRLMHRDPATGKYTYFFSALWDQAASTFQKVTQSLSFSLMMFSIGLLITLVYLMTR